MLIFIFISDRAIRTFHSFGSKGHALFMCSPSEVQKFCLSTPNGCSNLTDMLSELFDPKVVCPPPPKPNIFKSLFATSPLDREELCNYFFISFIYLAFEKTFFLNSW